MFLGVDGGGTKTAFCLLRSDGVVVGTAHGPTTYAHGDRRDLVRTVLADGVSAVCAAAQLVPADIEHAFFGLPGYGEVGAEVPVLDRIPAEVLRHHRYACDNDMVCGWAGSLGLTDGINVISGTGSMAFGVSGDRRARAGGWGEVFGDEGSGHWIAIRGLTGFSRMSDGRMARGPLHQLFREHLGVTDDLDVIDIVVNQWGGRRTDIAGLSTVVVDAAAQGDLCATTILTDAGAELALVVEGCRRRLDFPPGTIVPVSYSGGVFSSELVKGAFIREIHRRSGYDLRQPLFAPVVGAALYAARLAGRPLTDDAIQMLLTTMRSSRCAPASAPPDGSPTRP